MKLLIHVVAVAAAVVPAAVVVQYTHVRNTDSRFSYFVHFIRGNAIRCASGETSSDRRSKKGAVNRERRERGEREERERRERRREERENDSMVVNQGQLLCTV